MITFHEFKVFAHEPILPSNDKNDFYTAAAVEFATTPQGSDFVGVNIEEALTDYLRLINEASENGADIVVFPEGSLNYHGITTRESLREFAVELSDSEIRNSTSFDNVCDYSKMSNKVKSRVELPLVFHPLHSAFIIFFIDTSHDLLHCEKEQIIRPHQRYREN